MRSASPQAKDFSLTLASMGLKVQVRFTHQFQQFSREHNGLVATAGTK